MRRTDVAIVGGGLAGSLTAAMLGRADIDAMLIDPHPVYPADFRCEKLDRHQVRLFGKTGLGAVLPANATFSDEAWIVRPGERPVVDRRLGQYDLFYDMLVNAVRREIPAQIPFVEAKVSAVATSDDRQRVTLANGEEISARLVVMAIGLNPGLRHTLSMTRDVISPAHSISIGFDMKPIGRAHFDFPAMTYYPERLGERIAYLTLFPIGGTMRANLFVFRDMRDPWLKELRHAPENTLIAAMPDLAPLLGNFAVTGDVKIRPVDLYVTGGHRQAGVVLIGDAFATSCPAAGTGTSKVMADAEILCHTHIPAWLATPGMAADKIAAFYDDPAKLASDADAAARARYVKAIATDTSVAWTARRWANTLARRSGVATLRDLGSRIAAGTNVPVGHRL